MSMSEVAAMVSNPTRVTCAIMMLIDEARQGLRGIDGKELMPEQFRSGLGHVVKQALELEESVAKSATEREQFELDQQQWEKKRENMAIVMSDWRQENKLREKIARLLRALAAINEELLSYQGKRDAIGWHVKLAKRNEIKEELHAWEDELRDREECLQRDLLDLAEAEKGVEQESASKELNEGVCDLPAEDCRRRSMSESAQKSL